MDNNKTPGYFSQIDGLRAIAVTAVVYWHSVPQTQYLNSIFHTGGHGVRLFFVISGFLITLILLKAKREDSRSGFSGILKAFYIRRALRIWPAYYFYLFILALLAWDRIAGSFLWHLFFLSNMYHSTQNGWSFMTAHYWSLAVEEQFYLIWPFIILIARRGATYLIVIMMILCAPLFRFLMNIEYPHELISVLPLPAQLDSLGFGALLALLYSDDYIVRCRNSKGILNVIFVFGICFYFFAGLSAEHFEFQRYFLASKSTIAALVFFAIVGKAIVGIGGWPGIFLNNSIVAFIGKVSFGIYIYHFLAIKMVRVFVDNHHMVFFLSLLTSSLLAGISWRLLESPINSLKFFYPYTNSSPATFRKKLDHYKKNFYR